MIPLTQMARVAAIEIASVERGAKVLTALLHRLLNTGQTFALEAAQIAWECRSVGGLTNCLDQLVTSMAASGDVAIRKTAELLAIELDFVIPEKHNELPPVYLLAFPKDSSLEEFEPPSGVSSSSSGLYSEDVSSWTWVLEDPMRIASKARGIRLSNLRHRAAQLMSRNGGTRAFGPDAVRAQMSKLRRLSLHTSYKKLLSSAALEAMREVLGELVTADSINLRVVPLITIRSGAYSPIVRTRGPAKRPTGIASVSIPDVFGSHDDGKWVDGVSYDLVEPYIAGYSVLAATATHERSFRNESWLSEQYFGPLIDVESGNLFEHIQYLPKVVLTDRFEITYSKTSPGAVARPQPIMAGSIDFNELMMCPIVAAELGWSPDSNDAVTFKDSNNEVVACTMYWRDGGAGLERRKRQYAETDSLFWSERTASWSSCRSFAPGYEVRAWRRYQKSAEDVISRSAMKPLSQPSFAT